MRNPLKIIRLIIFIVFSFYIYFSVSFSNVFAVDYFRYKYIVEDNNIVDELIENSQYFAELRKNDFKDAVNNGSLSQEGRIILIYLNTLLNKILTDNKDILERFGRSSSEFFVYPDILPGDYIFASEGFGEIKVNILELYKNINSKDGYTYQSDSYIIAALSHEIAHDLLDHFHKTRAGVEYIYDTTEFKDKYTDINEYEFDGDLSNPEDKKRFLKQYAHKVLNLEERYELNADPSKPFIQRLDERSEFRKLHAGEDIIAQKLEEEQIRWEHFYPSQKYYRQLRKRFEIEADNLGLELYLNTGFKAIDFGSVYIQKKYDTTSYVDTPDIFRVLNENTYISEGERAIEEKRFDEFMESIKYKYPTEDIHPSDFWRYWNTRIQIESYEKNNGISLDSTIVNGLYFTIDLSQSERLDEIKRFFSNTDNLKFNIEDDNDPRFYIIEELLDPNSSLGYTIEFFTPDTDDIGRLRQDSTIILKARDVFQIALVMYNQDNDIDDDNYEEKYGKTCATLFRIKDQEIRELHNPIYASIKRAFL